MKLFVTGGTGFVGSHFVRQALGQGHDIVAPRRPGSAPRIPLDRQPTWIDAGLDGDFREHLEGVAAIVHFASHTPNPPYAPLADCLYWNVVAPIKLATQAVEAGIDRFLVAGSYFEYGTPDRSDLRVDTPLRPSLSYPVSKAAASVAFEGLARAHRVKLRLLRIFQVYGEGEQAARLWPSLREAAISGRDFPMSPGQQIRDFIDVKDVAASFLRHLHELESTVPGVPTTHHVASGQAQTLLAFAQHWWTHWDAQGRLLPGALPYRPGEAMRLVPETSAPPQVLD